MLPPICLRNILRPDRLSSLRIEAHDDAVAGHRIEAIAVYGRSAARAVAAIVSIGAAGGRLPKLFAGLRVERDDEFLIAALALRVDPVFHDGERRVSLAESLDLPHNTRTTLRPGLKQAG